MIIGKALIRIGWFFLFLIVLDSTVLHVAAESANAARDISFKSNLDGTEQRYVIQLPKDFDPGKPSGLLIALHGHGSDRLQFVNDARAECRAARDAAAKYRLIFVSPDYRAKTSWMGPAADSDLLQILDDLHHEYRIENVFICGGSMGGTSALAFATMHPQHVDGVVSLNGTANLVQYAGFPDAIAASYGGSKEQKPDEYRRRSAELFPENLTMPIGMTTGGRDTLVPPESCLRLAESLKQRESPIRLIHRAEGGHDTSYEDTSDVLQFVIEKTNELGLHSKPLLTFQDKPRTIVCLGDSVTGVYYHTGGHRAYPEMLELGLRKMFPKSEIKVINAGISGQTTNEGLERLDRDVLSQKPDLVTISFGLNDVARLSPDAYRANLISLIRKCREQNCEVLLCTPNAVIDTTSRPIEKLVSYCEIIRSVGRDASVRVCDQYQAGSRLRTRAPWTWRLTMSDEIHPNMDGHKRMAEELCRSITGEIPSLDSLSPPADSLSHTRARMKNGKPVRVLAMPPYDALVGDLLKQLDPTATVDVTTWAVEAKSIPDLEQDAKARVRPFKPDLVVLAVPRDSGKETDEQFVHSYSWIMNWSLSFGHQEWDCIVIHPSVASPGTIGARDDLIRRLVKAEHLNLVDRPQNDISTAVELLTDWLKKH